MNLQKKLVSNGKRRHQRRVARRQQTMDEQGYSRVVTKQEVEWKSFPEDRSSGPITAAAAAVQDEVASSICSENEEAGCEGRAGQHHVFLQQEVTRVRTAG